MKHPAIVDLALYAGGDLPFWKRLWLGRHVESCPVCRAEVGAFREAQLELQFAAEDLPASLNWNRLAAEMKANIRVGLAAGECVRSAASPQEEQAGDGLPAAPPELWRFASVATAILLLVVGGWWWKGNQPGLAPGATRTAGAEVVLKATLGGIGVEQNGAAFVLAPSRGETLTISADTNGVLKTGYVDDESGQVTIHHVYAE
jgi:hypothetical protein